MLYMHTVAMISSIQASDSRQSLGPNLGAMGVGGYVSVDQASEPA